MYVKDGGNKAVATRETDKAGRFRFEAVPASIPLSLGLGNERPAPSISSSTMIGSSPRVKFARTTISGPALLKCTGTVAHSNGTTRRPDRDHLP